HAGNRQQRLGGEVPCGDPVRFEVGVGGNISAGILAVAQEGRMAWVQLVVDARIEQPAVERALTDVIEGEEDRIAVGYGDDGHLVVVIEICKPEELVLLQGASQSEPALAAGEERVPISGVALEPRVGRQVVIAEEKEAAAVELVAAGSGDDVNGT